MTRGSIWIHPTDVRDEGAAATFAALKEMGLREISLAASYHGARFLLPHSPKATVRDVEDGAAYYTPDPKRWEKLKLRPKQADACGGKDLFREVRDAAASAGLATNAWVVALHDSRLGAAHPECALVNAFGEKYLYGLCPSHPDARAYAVALASDVATRLEPAALELEAFGFMGHAHQSHHEKAAVKLDGAHDFLLSLCFCDHCARRMQARKVVAERVAEKARKLVKEYLDRGGKTDDGAVLERPEVIGPWLTKRIGALEFAGVLSARKECVVSLLSEVREQVPRKIELHAMAHASPFVTGAAIGGGLQALGEVVDAFILNLFESDLARIVAQVKSAQTAAAPGARFMANLRVFAPDSASSQQFLEKVRALKKEGVDELRLYHYGLLPRAHFAWVSEAMKS